MLKKTISYTDYDGNQRTEDFHFNLSMVRSPGFGSYTANCTRYSHSVSLRLQCLTP